MIASAIRRPSVRKQPARTRPPLALVAIAVVVSGLAAIPLVHLLAQALAGGSDALGIIVRARTLELLATTLALALAVAAGAVTLGLPLAWLTARTDLPGRRAWTILVMAPLAIPSYLLAFSFVGAFAPRGWSREVLEPLGDHLPAPYGFGGALVVLMLATTPYVVIAARAAFARLDASTVEAARALGEGPWAAARTAIVPVIRPAVGAGALLAGLYALSDFGAVSILRVDTLATAVYSQYRLSFDRSNAAATAMLLVLLSLALVWSEGRLRRRAALRTSHGRRRPPAATRLGHWRFPALALCLAVTSLSLGIPVVTVLAWLGSAWGDAVPLAETLEALASSVGLASSAALAAIALSVPSAWMAVHHPSAWATLSDRLIHVLYAIPGISLALAVVSFTLELTPLLYQSLAVLVIAVAMRFLAQGVGALRAPAAQVSARTLEAARSLGEGPLGLLRRVTLPLLGPGLVAGMALVFLSALKELPLTLLLAPTGFRTLAVELWDAARDAHYGEAAIPGLLLLLVSFLSVGVLMRRWDVTA